MGLFWLLVFPGVMWGLPGYLASRWCLPRATALERTATSALFGAGLVVPLSYTIPYVTRQPIGPWWIALACAFVSLLFAALLRWRPRDPERVRPTPGFAEAQGPAVTLGVVALVVFVALSAIPRSFQAVEVFSPCPHQASMFLLEDGSGNGLETWDPLWQTRVTHVTEHEAEPGYGLGKILTIQRIGSAATLVEHVVFHGSGGLPVACITYFGIVTLFSALLITQWLRSRALVLVLTATTLIAYSLAGSYMVNENLLAASLITGVLWLVLRHRPTDGPAATPDGPTLVLAGIVYAHAVATRPELGLVLPALLLFARPWSIGRLLVVGAVAAAFMTPWLLTTYESFGQALYHPSLNRGRIPMELFGVKFLFHPLNWPFSPTLMRPDTDPYPNLLMLPLENLGEFGVPFAALCLVGLRRVGLRKLGLFALYSLPIYLILLAIVNLDRDKLSYCVMTFGPLPYLAAAGLSQLIARPFSVRTAMAFGASVVGLVFGPMALRGLDFPVDRRKQLNESRDRRDFLPIEEKRASLTSPTFLPMLDWPDATQGLEWSGSLLWNGRPVHRGAGPAAGKVQVWCEKVPLIRDFDVALMDAPSLPPYIADPSDFELTKDYVPMSLAVTTTADVVRVHFSRTNALEVFIQTPSGTAPEAGAPTKYLTLGLLDDGQQPIDAIHVQVDGRDVPLEILVVERSDRPTKPGLVANHPWRYELVDDPDSHTERTQKLVLVPKAWPARECPGHTDDEIVFGPGAILDRRESDHRPPILLRTTSVFPPRDEPACPALRIRPDGDGGGGQGHGR